jgi:DNA-binding transcriptional MerR regulator
MPNIIDGDDDWITLQEKEMNLEQIKMALEVGKTLNEIRCELYNAQMDRDKARVELVRKNLVRWTERWIRVRKNSTFYYSVSSFVNADILQEGFFRDTFKALGIEEFKSAILSFKVNITKGEKFYGQLGEHHFYDDGVNSGYYDKYMLTDEIEESCLALKYLDHNAKLEMGIDFGDMCSAVMAQPRGNHLYCHKEFYTLAPESSKELAEKIKEFYKHHKHKEIDMYYDRSGNQYAKIKRDWASELKREIEFTNGVPSGWTVNLKSQNQSTIYQEEEFSFARNLMGEMSKELPILKIDKFQCKCLKSSLELTKIRTIIDKKGSKSLHKDKSSEKLAMHLRPMFSTNFSDAFKYLIYRREWVNKLKNSNGTEFMDAGIF